MILLIVVITYIALEIVAFFGVKYLRSQFPWFITAKDVVPKISEKDIDHFFESGGFDPLLGWDRKPSTSKTEPAKTVGEIRSNPKLSSYSIDEFGNRRNDQFNNLPVRISTYGDSFAFCRHVNDNETIQYYLSDLTQSNVTNRGVGNYGVDQALKKLERDFSNLPSETVIMIVVPETISRIINVWKHYSEYGNLLGFKGRYILESESILRWIPNPMMSQNAFNSISEKAAVIQEMDECYSMKFTHDLVCFPYLWSFLKNPFRNIPLALQITARSLCSHLGIENETLQNAPWKKIMQRNSHFVRELYSRPETVELLRAVISEYCRFVCAKGAKPVFVMSPYLEDVEYTRTNSHFYNKVFDNLDSRLTIIDMMDIFLEEKDPKSLYVGPVNGAHLNSKGNALVAKKIFSVLQLDVHGKSV
jgi:hypothetical protein